MTPLAFDPPIGIAERLTPWVERVLAPNASPMTFRGTNSYLYGQDSLALIDPGPDSAPHRQALLAAINGRPVTAILVTHSHLDHSPLARPLGQALGVPVYGFGNSKAGRSEVMQTLSLPGTEGGEGVDHDFTPDIRLFDGAIVTGDNWSLTALHTPGHFGNHLCFSDGLHLFSGDHVMGWASSLVSPPDGDLTQFMASCRNLLNRPESQYFPGHGAPINDPQARLRWLIDHRLQRENQILQQLQAGVTNAYEITENLYSDVPRALHPAALRNVFAHLIDLHQRGLIHARPSLAVTANFTPEG